MRLISVFSTVTGLAASIPYLLPNRMMASEPIENIEGKGRYREKPSTSWYIGCATPSECYFTYATVPTPLKVLDVTTSHTTKLPAGATSPFETSSALGESVDPVSSERSSHVGLDRI
jgi:hypothetical protein